MELRYSGASLRYQVGTVFGGGLAPFVTASLLTATAPAGRRKLDRRAARKQHHLDSAAAAAGQPRRED